MDYVPVERGGFGCRGEEGAVGVVLFGGEDEGDVINAVAGGEVESVFGRVVKDVGACLAVVGVFCGLWRMLVWDLGMVRGTESRAYVVNGMVVIPECSCGLAVGVVVIFVPAGRSDIFCPSVKGGSLFDVVSVSLSDHQRAGGHTEKEP